MRIEIDEDFMSYTIVIVNPEYPFLGQVDFSPFYRQQKTFFWTPEELVEEMNMENATLKIYVKDWKEKFKHLAKPLIEFNGVHNYVKELRYDER